MTREQAQREAWRRTDGRCLFTGLSGADPAHAFAAGDFPALANCPFNIFYIVRQCHSVRGEPCFDWKQVKGVDIVRPVAERLWMLTNMVCEPMWDYRGAIRRALQLLAEECGRVRVEYPRMPVCPSDYYALRLRGRE